MAKSTSGKTVIVILLLVGVAAGAGLAWRAMQVPDAAVAAKAAAAKDLTSEMSDEKRGEYLKEFGAVDDLKIAPDTKPDSDDIVPGLLRVVGTVRNNGPRRLHKAFVYIYPKDGQGEVLGSHVENVVKKGGPLAPGESRDFRFLIPEKKAFEGDFGHSLR